MTTTEELKRQLDELKIVYDTAQERKGMTPQNFPGYQLIYLHQMSYQRAQKMNGNPVLNSSTVFDVYCSKESVRSLQPMLFKDLKLVIKGNWLFSRSLNNHIVQLVSSPFLYNYAKNLDVKAEDVLQVGMVMFVKEPYCKLTKGGGFMIRCDSLSDIIVVHQHDENFVRFHVDKIECWKPLAKDKIWTGAPTTGLDRKERGNQLFKRGDYDSAIRAYSVGIQMGSEEYDLVLRLNRACVYLADGRFDNAKVDAEYVVERDPSNVKALYRAGKAHYQLCNFEKAADYYKKLVNIDKSKTNDDEYQRTMKRLIDQRGQYNFTEIYKKCLKDPRHNFDIADYCGPLKVVEIPGKGLGVVATEDITPGTLLVVSKAFQVYLQVNTLGSIWFPQLLTRSANARPLQKKSILSGQELTMIVCFSEDGQVIVDIELIDRICSLNAFHADNQKHTKEEDSPTGLWILPSFFNHSCIDNAQRVFRGDVMIITAKQYISKGEESSLKQYGFVCKCALCVSDLGTDMKTIETLFKEFESDLSPRIRNGDQTVVTRLKLMIKKLKKSYRKSLWKTLLYSPMCCLAQQYQQPGQIQEAVSVLEENFPIRKRG
ncbi:hypothetical protein HDV02_003039 [Globomyces sp. JEL0801]|nr:hypothetical protein HDV02_003039 [Globomyces sp. JEL0801]